MLEFARAIAIGAAILVAAASPVSAQKSPPVQSRIADVNGIKMHYLIAGKG